MEQYYEDANGAPSIGDVVNGYRLDRLIDDTKNSTVFVSSDLETKEKVAIKFIKYRKSTSERVERELELMKMCDSPYIIQSKQVFDFPPFKCVVMPLAIGDLHVLAQKLDKHRLNEETVKHIMKSALEALKYLHDKKICHRDIKPDNFLVLQEEEEEPVLLADLGFAKVFNDDELCNEYLGTLNYAAPEVISGTPYDKSVDIWSLGVSMYTLLSGTQPFPMNPESTLRRCIRTGAFFFPATNWANISKEAKDLISHMIKVKPFDRYSAEQCLSHKWFSSGPIPHSKSWTCLSKICPQSNSY